MGLGEGLNFEMFYLRAQRELEGVLGLVFMFHELVRPMRMFVARSGDSWDNQIKKAKMFPLF